MTRTQQECDLINRWAVRIIDELKEGVIEEADAYFLCSYTIKNVLWGLYDEIKGNIT